MLFSSGAGPIWKTSSLNKKVELIGEDSGGGAPVIEPSVKGNGIDILANGCRVEGFTIQNILSDTGIRVRSNENNISRNLILNNSQGISLDSAMKNSINRNTITNSSKIGIEFRASNENLIEKNRILKNSVGIEVDQYSLSNKIYLNNFDNSLNVNSGSATSAWNTSDVFSYTYLGLQKESRLGNYWSDYYGKDENFDGVGDFANNIRLGGNPKSILHQDIWDYYPLKDPIEYYYIAGRVSPEPSPQNRFLCRQSPRGLTSRPPLQLLLQSPRKHLKSPLRFPDQMVRDSRQTS